MENKNPLTQTHKMPDYDLHMPRNLSFPIPVVGIALLLASLSYIFLRATPAISAILIAVCSFGGLAYVGIHLFLKRLTNLEFRLKARDTFLAEIPWKGDETVLDVGCGNGILTMGAAQRLSTGKITGVDIWTEGSGDNRREIFVENATIESVSERVEIQNQDVRNLPYADETFDVVISGLTVHHLGFDTEKGMREMVRVLKPGGWLAIYDEPSTIFYSAKLMQKFGINVKNRSLNMIFGVLEVSES